MKALYILFALDLLNMAMFLPVFSQFLRSLGGTRMAMGFINSGCALISLLWNPIIGSLSDQIGRRDLLTKCLLANMIGCLIMAFSSGSILLVTVGRIVGAFGSPGNILLRTVVTDVYRTSEEKKAFFNKSGPILSAMFLSGSLISGFLSETQHGYMKVFLLMSLILGSSAYITTTRLPDDTKRATFKGKKISFAKRATKELKSAVVNMKSIDWSRYWNIFVIRAAYDFGMNILFSNLGLILVNEFELKGRKMGYVFLYMSIVGIMSNIAKLKLKPVIDKIPDYTKVVYGGLLLMTAFAGLSLSRSLYAFMLFLGAAGLSKSFMEITFTEIITTRSLDTDRGKVIGAFDNLNPLALFIVPALSGVFAEVFGERILIATAIIPISIVTIMSHKSKSKTA